MATPSSSATSASPPMAYLQPNTKTPTTMTIGLDPLEREQRKRAVQKFLARAEISMVTRGLRARLSYASYKATHNIPHVSLRDLEAQTQIPTASLAAKRKVGSNNYYNNPATQGTAGSSSAATSTTARRGSMAPPPVASASRHYPSVTAASRSANATQSLYTSILTPPPAKQARTIHNASDPPLPPPARPYANPRSRRGSRSSDSRSARSVAESTRAQAKSRKDDAKAPNRRKMKRADKGKQKARSSPQSVPGTREDADVDMKAAATLTSLLMHSRPSLGSVSSPRSSIGSSDAGSTQSYSHFAQSSTRTTTASSSMATSAESSFVLPNHRSSTPPPLSAADTVLDHGNTTPKASGPYRAHAPTDSEAADLMLFLATSPSPARPTTNRDKDSKDSAAFRSLGGSGNIRAKGRVLFPTPDSTADVQENSGWPLTRADTSFASSTSTIGSQFGSMDDMSGIPSSKGVSNPPLGVSRANTMEVIYSSAGLTPTELFPSPTTSSPQPPNSDESSPPAPLNPWPSPYPSAEFKTSPHGPPTPGNLPFNFNDFINVSPSPAAIPSRSINAGGLIKSSLRADVGRKLFEEEQQRHSRDLGVSMSTGRTQSFGEEFGGDRTARGSSMGLGAGIDLVQS